MELMRKDWGTGKDAIHDCDCSNLIGLEASWEAFGRAVMLDEDERKRGAQMHLFRKVLVRWPIEPLRQPCLGIASRVGHSPSSPYANITNPYQSLLRTLSYTTSKSADVELLGREHGIGQRSKQSSWT